MKQGLGRSLVSLVFALGLMCYGVPAQAAILEVPSIDYPTIQSAISAAISGVDSVLVHNGTYMENINFWGKKGITVRSKNGAGVTIINGSTPIDPDKGSVVTFSGGEDSTSVLEGFTITGGTGTVGFWGFTYGGGIYCKSTTPSPTIRNCIITYNIADCGGGISCGNLTRITDCTITNNTANSVGGVRLGGSAMIFNCTISNNTAISGNAGGICCQYASGVRIINCTITGNTTAPEWAGGGISSNGDGPGGSPVEVTNCIISGNIAGIGGGIYCDWYTLLAVTNCTITGNSATYLDPDFQGGGIYCRATSPPTVANSILWGNSPQEIQLNNSNIIVKYSDIEGGWIGEGNINDNPLFVGAGDYHLIAGSPCIDKGTQEGAPVDDIDGDRRPQGAGYDIGADEYLSTVIDPIPDIKANGSDGPVTISQGDNLTVAVALDPGSHDGENADWWVLAGTPFGWYYYNVSEDSWTPGFAVTHQGPLFNLTPREVLNITGLPVGTYTFYFGVDMVMNGSLDMDQIYYDNVEVNIE